MLAAIYTLGCKVNQYETQAMEQELVRRGHTLVPFDEKADVYIVNTCSVTAVSDKKSRQMLRRCRKLNPEAVVAACGCYVQTHPEEAASLDIDLVAGTGDRMAFLELLEQVSREKQVTLLDDALKRRTFEVLPAGGMAERTRAMLKVEDGCVNFCSYCIIPYTRGPIRSAPVDVAVSQAQELARRGYREIVVTGIEIASWGADLPGKPEVTELIEAVCTAVPALRVRLGSLEPRIVTEDFCRRLSRLPNLCPQFHLSMQSGCDTVLQRMRRKYDTARYYESVCLLRTWFPGCAVTTDMIVAFPGETEDEFARSLAFIRKCGFAEMHIFPYSRRPGTPADKMPGQHGNAVKEARSRAAIAVAEEMSRAYREALIGSVQSVLFEDMEDGLFTGHAPNYVKVYVPGEGLHNQVRRVRITGLCKDGLTGSLEP